MKVSPVMASAPDEYETQQDVDALTRAHEVKSDPKRHAKAKAHAKKKLAEHNKKGDVLKKVATRDDRATKIGQAFEAKH